MFKFKFNIGDFVVVPFNEHNVGFSVPVPAKIVNRKKILWYKEYTVIADSPNGKQYIIEFGEDEVLEHDVACFNC